MTSGTPTRMAAWLESAWLARYFDRQLEGEELAWFEGYLLDKPELVEAVEVENEIRDGFAHPHVMASKEPLKSPARHRWPKGVAAAMVLLVAGVVGIARFGNRTERAVTIVANPTRIVFDAQRGMTSAPTIERAHNAGEYELIEIAVPWDAMEAKIVLADKTQYDLEVSPDGFVSFLMKSDAASRLAPATLFYKSGGTPASRRIELPSTKSGDGK